jgi:hypothetical protein
MRIALVVIAAASLTAAPPAFYPDDPLRDEPAPVNVDKALSRKLSDFYDFFQNNFARPGRHDKQAPALGANTLGEPMDGAWYTHRHYSRPMSIEELKLGPGGRTPPAASGPWTVIKAKSEGVTPGFTIVDANKRVYFLKFDPATNPEMATAADAIVARIFHALGYHVPDNYVVHFDESRLVLGQGVTLADELGHKRKMTRRDLLEVLLPVPRDSRGRIRAIASRAVDGKPLGPFRYHGLRKDDPNDIVPHERRRELRALRVFCAWLNHEDSRAVNTLDALVQTGGKRYIRHYLIDFGSTLGSASTKANPPRSGHEYLFNWRTAGHHFFTLGLDVPAWARAHYPDYPAVGRIEASTFNPETWVAEYPNPAFEQCDAADAFWAAKQVMSFTDEQLRALVSTGQYSNPEAEAYIVKVLAERRDRVGRAYLEKVLPLDNFTVRGRRLMFDDLGLRHGTAKERPLQISWSRFNNASARGTPIEGAAGFDVPAAGGTHFYLAEIKQTGDQRRVVRVYLRQTGENLSVAGVDRSW